jgi:hypothetical protein
MAGVKRNVVALIGGLGNQLFQVAFGAWLEERSGRPTFYDASFHRDLDIDVLRLPGVGPAVAPRVLRGTGRLPTPDGRIALAGRSVRRALGPGRLTRDYSGPGPDSVDTTGAAWWFGYWQRARYAASLLDGPLSALASDGPSPPVVGVHVRRGDMLLTPSALPAEWFGEALRGLRGRAELRTARVRVWSDDPAWCRAELDLGTSFDVAEGGDPIDDLKGLANCDALVISRSTFSWWGAAIAGRRGIPVACPSPWWTDASAADETILPAQWTRVPSRIAVARTESPST